MKGFADDAALVLKGPVHSAEVGGCPEALNAALDFGRAYGLELSADKTVVVIFTRKKINYGVWKLRMGSTELV